MGVYGVDAVLTIVHRLILKENIFEAHRKHLYQILANEAKIPHLSVAIIYTAIQIAINCFALFLLQSNFSVLYTILLVAGVLILMALVYVLVKKKYFHLHKLE